MAAAIGDRPLQPTSSGSLSPLCTRTARSNCSLHTCRGLRQMLADIPDLQGATYNAYDTSLSSPWHASMSEQHSIDITSCCSEGKHAEAEHAHSFHMQRQSEGIQASGGPSSRPLKSRSAAACTCTLDPICSHKAYLCESCRRSSVAFMRRPPKMISCGTLSTYPQKLMLLPRRMP